LEVFKSKFKEELAALRQKQETLEAHMVSIIAKQETMEAQMVNVMVKQDGTSYVPRPFYSC